MHDGKTQQERVSSMGNLSDAIADLSPEQQALLIQWLREKAKDQKDQKRQAPPIVPVSRDRELPLSFAQQRLWFLNQLEPESSVYNVPGAAHYLGVFNIAAFKQALEEIINRHEVLRTTFKSVDGRPVQTIAQSAFSEFPIIDLQGVCEHERLALAARLVDEDATRPFDLGRGPIIRAALLRMGQRDHGLLLTMHHIASDGWSRGILTGNLAAAYDAFDQGKRSPLPPLPIQYADFAIWQREWLQGEVLETELSHWREKLDCSSTELQLQLDYPRPTTRSFNGNSVFLPLSESLTKAIRALSREQGATIFMTLLAAFNVLLFRYTGQNRIAVGTPVANRNRYEIEQLIGFFVNTLVMQTDLSGDPTFRELITRVREVSLDAYSHQDLPFEKLVEELRQNRDSGQNPLFQVMFAVQNAPQQINEAREVVTESFGVKSKSTQFDLTLEMLESDDRISALITYNTDLFFDATIHRMLGYLREILEECTGCPDHRISEIPLLTEFEQHQLQIEWNDTSDASAGVDPVYRLIEAQTERRPDAIAVVCGNEQITYDHLNQSANQLAHRLRKIGAGPEVLIGICLERSPLMILAMLAVLKSGAAYLPIDSQTTPERLSSILEDSGTEILITSSRLSSGFQQFAGTLVLLDELESLASEFSQNPNIAVTDDNLAYVVYTSGTTGKPNGVMIQHRSLTNFIRMINEHYNWDSGDTVLQFASISFDASIEEIFNTLVHGAKLVLRNPSSSLIPGDFLQECCLNEITILDLPTAYWHQLVSDLSFQKLDFPRHIREVVLGGEKASRDKLHSWQHEVDLSVRTVNSYGPTETTVAATICDFSDTVSLFDGSRELPIGRGIGNVQAFVLDKHLNPMPIGAAGELYLAGECLARGYLKKQELTAAKFIPVPLSEGRGARMYRTGDIARFRHDGQLEFLGRIDNQVKIRGFRVEPAEIEAHLGRHPSVRDCVVTVHSDKNEDKRLIAYLVCDDGERAGLDSLRNFLKKTLPDYMIPSTFMFLESLPLTTSGKVNRHALPSPEAGSEDPGKNTEARNPIEELLKGIWSHVLNTSQINVYDNFFEAGGHSLLATQVISRVRKAFQIELPLSSIFESPTIAELAIRIESELRAFPSTRSIPIRRDDREDVFPLSFAQQRLWFLDKLNPGNIAYNSATAALARGTLAIPALEQSVREVVRRHEILRTTFPTVDGQPKQCIARPEHLTFVVSDLSGLQVVEQTRLARRLARIEAERPFDLENGPLIRTGLIRLNSAEHAILFNKHHIVADAWSDKIISNETATINEDFKSGTPSRLSELTVQYADYASWQRLSMQEEDLERDLEYWMRQLEGAPTVLEIPTDRPRPVVESSRGETQALLLSSVLTSSIKRLAQSEGLTVFMTLLAGFNVLLHYYTGQDDIVVGTDIAGRNMTEFEDIVGLFVNQLVLRNRLNRNSTFRELLSQVRSVTLGAYTHQGLPFDKLVDAIKPNRDLKRNPLFQIMFSFQNIPGSKSEDTDVLIESLDTNNQTSIFDFSLYMMDTENGLVGWARYNKDLFDYSTIAKFLSYYEKLLNCVVDNPDVSLVALTQILKDAELQENAARGKELKDASLSKLRNVRRRKPTELIESIKGDQ